MNSTFHKNDKIILVILMTLLGLIILRHAWVCDDAYITFRTVDNFINGYGLTWNTVERVQSFTNPLWMFVVSFFYLFTGEIYFTVIILSLVIVLLAAGWAVFRISESAIAAISVLIMLLFSKAFVEYATSGLENPLSFLLVILFLWVFLKKEMTLPNLFYLALIASLAAVNRVDCLLLYLPALLYYLWSLPKLKAVKKILLGFLPFIAWEMFSLIYYGFLIPNTAYAKLNNGYSQIQMFQQGLLYYLDILYRDPLTILIIISALISVLIFRQRRLSLVASGIVLYLIYIVYIGGDFMSGRFLTVPFVAAVIVLSRVPFENQLIRWTGFLAVIIIVGFIGPHPTLFSDRYFGTEPIKGRDFTGICDERSVYYQTTGLLNVRRNVPMPMHEWVDIGRQMKAKAPQTVVWGIAGFPGFYAGPKVHIIDFYALTEPLLARLPALKHYEWRIGHFKRVLPQGYEATIKTGENHITDSSLAQYYEKIKIITRGNISSSQRFRDILTSNLGFYNHLRDKYLHPPRIKIGYSDINIPKSQGTSWKAEGNYIIKKSGLEINLDSLTRFPLLEISLDHNDDYIISYCRDGKKIADQTVKAKLIEHSGLRVDTLAVPTDKMPEGCNSIIIVPSGGDLLYSVGHVRFLENNLPKENE